MEKRFIVAVVFATVLVLVGGNFVITSVNSSQAVKFSQNAKVDVPDPTSYDWGNIPYGGGNATKSFTIKNSGSEMLKVYNVKTSCHCTKAYMTIDGNKSPEFGMSSFSSWNGEVFPGKEAVLTVVFDPAFHGPQGIGPINRFVSVETNDRANSKLTFTVTGIVVK